MKFGMKAVSNPLVGGWRRIAVLGLIPATVLAACGSSSTASPTSSTAAASTTTSTAAPVSITLAKAINTEPFATANVAEQLGYFKSAGLNVKIETVAGSSVANAALQSGSVQFVLASSAALLLAAAKKIPLLAVGGIDKGDGVQLVVSNTWIKAHNLSPSQPLAERIKGLAGTTLATLSTSDKSVMEDFLAQEGVPASAVKDVSMNSAASQLAAVQHGLAQEFIASPPNSSIAVAGGYGTVLANAKELPYLSDEAYDILITTPAYAKAHPEVVKAMVGAFQKAIAQMSQGTSAAITAMQPLYPTLTPAVIKSSLGSITFTPTMQQTQIGWNDALTFAKKTGLVKAGQTLDVTEGTVWTNQFSG
ncbi:MAG: ABC transporter substrate-binding protein [Acidimicrobiaceae bacterium]|nr:ABC transporter substrate-binding protein [Acidimicrobiaceae bacterium]